MVAHASPNVSSRCRAFTLLEVLIVVSVIAVVAAIVSPMFSDDAPLRVRAAARVLASDIEYAQVLSIAHPQQPMVVKFSDDLASYWLALASDPELPIAREDTGEPYLVTFGAGRASPAEGIALELVDVKANCIQFTSTGGLNEFSVTPIIRIIHGESGAALTVAPTTGSITESWYDPTP